MIILIIIFHASIILFKNYIYQIFQHLKKQPRIDRNLQVTFLSQQKAKCITSYINIYLMQLVIQCIFEITLNQSVIPFVSLSSNSLMIFFYILNTLQNTFVYLCYIINIFSGYQLSDSQIKLIQYFNFFKFYCQNQLSIMCM